MRDQNLVLKISNPKCELQMNKTFNFKTITEIKKLFLEMDSCLLSLQLKNKKELKGNKFLK